MKFILVCFTLILYLNMHAQKLFDVSSIDLVNSDFIHLSNTKFLANDNFSPIRGTPSPGNNCFDSSFTRSISLTNQSVIVDNILHIEDDGVLVCGGMYDTTKYNPYRHYSGFLMKMDNKGDILWVKQITDAGTHTFSDIFAYTLKELPDHDIIVAASMDTTHNSNYSAIILKFKGNGDLLWYKSIQTSLFSTSEWNSIAIESIEEAANGDLILCGTSTEYTFDGQNETIIRMSAQGNVIWSDNFGNNNGFAAGASGIAAYVINGNIVECGLSFGGTDNAYVTAINFLTLDYSTGNLLNKKFYVPNYSDVHKNQHKGFGNNESEKLKVLSNGHYLIYGQIYQGGLTNDSTDYFGVAEFDEAFNLVNSYLISAANKTDIYAGSIEIADDGKAYYSLSNENDTDIFIVSDNGNQSSKSRKIHYGAETYLNSITTLAPFNDKGYGFVQSYSSNANGDKNNFEFKKLHDVDTVSGCFGIDSLLTVHAPYNLKQDPGFKYLDNNIPNKTITAGYKISVSDFTDFTTENRCVQENNCDSIRIHGTPNICGSEDAAYFTASRNRNCGAFAQWNMDTSVISSLKQVNDTTVEIRFKSVNWDGKLYAKLAAASCINEPEDSIELHVKALPVSKLSLGADTIFCPDDNSFILHAGPDFKKYAWQDGSTDSIFAVTTTGRYYVTVTDLCNNFQSDTINATTAKDAFKIGKDTAKCNNDTISLKAPMGFINYSWLPNYNIEKPANNVVQVFPDVDTSYTASAQITGCSVYDTVHIQVFHSPSIRLGNDTAICYGTKLTLDAGKGFDQYVWNNGSQSESIYADNAGVYSVKANAGNNCVSYDTIKITALNPLPFVSLGNDTAFCSGDEFTLRPVIKNAEKYYWQDGSTLPYITIKNQGEYFFTASNTCGSYTDSIKISEAVCKLILPSAFTPNSDGLNDVFQVKYPFPVKSYKMVIYNRWGQQVFISEDITKGWDGNYKGTPVNQATFIWIASVTDINNVKTTLHGTVTVVR